MSPLELMGDYNSGDPVTSGEAYARFENPTKLVKYLRDELKADLRDDNKVDRPIRFETEIRPALLGRFEYTNTTYAKETRLINTELNSFDITKHIQQMARVQTELKAMASLLLLFRTWFSAAGICGSCDIPRT